MVNVNNNCSTGSTALYLARQAVLSGQAECALALGFEKMSAGSLSNVFQDRTNPLDVTLLTMNELRGIDAKAPFAPQIFGNAGLEYCERFGGNKDAMDVIAFKSHSHSTLNPYAQFRTKYTLQQVKKARTVYGPLTLLHCSPTSDGAGAVVVASEAFVKSRGLARQAIEIAAQTMATDSPRAFGPFKPVAEKSSIEIAGADMTRRAVADAYRMAHISAVDVDVVELHDCFSANELITYEALGLCEKGKACDFTLSGATMLPQFEREMKEALSVGIPAKRRVVVNPSGGLISKGHPLGATGLAQCAELVWQLRGWAGQRQVPSPRYALQHNIGLGGAVVIGIYKRADEKSLESGNSQWQDSRSRFGYNPAIECRSVTVSDVQSIISKQGGLIGTPSKLIPEIQHKLNREIAAKI